jgi:hypothetical protein
MFEGSIPVDKRTSELVKARLTRGLSLRNSMRAPPTESWTSRSRQALIRLALVIFLQHHLAVPT